MTRLAILATVVVALLPSAIPHGAEAGARRSRPLKTGQMTCWSAAGTVISCAGTDQDGDLQRGEPRAYEDFGNGTVRDKRTALTWEKLSDDGSIHDKDTLYTWTEAFDRIDSLNTPPCFAGSCDWRLPSPFELYSIVDAGRLPPAVSPVFDTSCAQGCTVLTCSCTGSTYYYWTSVTNVDTPTYAVLVHFFNGGGIGSALKTSSIGRVRAVRGGS